ncbi:hypothetical protein THSYN_18955 [Candidatus Thiodictyon syntrophicum]|uniref:Uncharacterized protein n=1 Tax=Candidatus Thiodictyon syntrophicum TaxID=1166950 RepID=A0A2K8UB60_9GAMM|nr:hypothetical protein THSYN_18955 [Candidatus Thiodictyon syntrophicum]
MVQMPTAGIEAVVLGGTGQEDGPEEPLQGVQAVGRRGPGDGLLQPSAGAGDRTGAGQDAAGRGQGRPVPDPTAPDSWTAMTDLLRSVTGAEHINPIAVPIRGRRTGRAAPARGRGSGLSPDPGGAGIMAVFPP